MPWTFLFSAPFFLVGNALGGYDQRVVYLILYVLMLVAAVTLAEKPQHRIALVAILALNPVMALDVLFGQNDVFVLSWIVLALAAWKRWTCSRMRGESGGWPWLAATIFYGVACASKPTAWFFAPFLALLFAEGAGAVSTGFTEDLRRMLRMLWQGALRLWPSLVTFFIVLFPWLIWDPWAMYDDVWRWSSGQGETGYQIWGWGASNFVLAAGWVQSRFAQFPFLLAEALVGIPLLIWFLLRQSRHNRIDAACWHYGWLLFAFFYVSRFLNENYLGYILAFLALGIIASGPHSASSGISASGSTKNS